MQHDTTDFQIQKFGTNTLCGWCWKAFKETNIPHQQWPTVPLTCDSTGGPGSKIMHIMHGHQREPTLAFQDLVATNHKCFRTKAPEPTSVENICSWSKRGEFSHCASTFRTMCSSHSFRVRYLISGTEVSCG